MTHSARSLGILVILGLAMAISGCTPAGPSDADSTATPMPSAVTSSEPIESTDPGSEVAFQMYDKHTRYADGPGVVIIVGQAMTGVFRPGDGIELLGGGPDSGTVILEIRQGAPSVVVDSLPAGEYGEFLVNGTLDDFDFHEDFVRPTE